MAIRAVAFDVGETLIDESRMWRGWADHLGVPFEAFMAELEAVIARGEHHRRVFNRFDDSFDLAAAQRDLESRGLAYRHEARDLYPDARDGLAALRAAGYFVAIAGNQPRTARDDLEAMMLPVDAIMTSDDLGAEKPSAVFFERLARRCGFAPGEVAYVGDRADNDVTPVKAAGMAAIFIVRGPWGRIHAGQQAAKQADARVGSLAEIPMALRMIGRV